MLASSIRVRLAAALPVLLLAGSLALAGCKQDIGERCEQNSDCASGVCGEGGPPGMTSAMGKKCVATLSIPAPQTDGMQNQSDAASEASEASSSDAPQSGADTGGPDTSSASDGASGAAEVSTEAGAGG